MHLEAAGKGVFDESDKTMTIVGGLPEGYFCLSASMIGAQPGLPPEAIGALLQRGRRDVVSIRVGIMSGRLRVVVGVSNENSHRRWQQ